METKNSFLDEFLETFDELSPEELERVEKRLVSAREKKNGNAPVSAAPSVTRDLFAISFNEYLAMPQAERETIDILAYKRYSNWIEQELNQHDARWILVCGGKVIESGPTLRSYPRSQKLQAVGEQYGLMPFVFLRGPMIEESIWAVLPYNDSYPSLPIIVAAENENPPNLKASGLIIDDADLDTGSTDVMLDYEQLLENGIITDQVVEKLHVHSHLNRDFYYYSRWVRIGVITENDEMISGVIEALCIRDWAKSPLVAVNRSRQALVGRNLLYELPLRIELDGRKRTTQILGQ
jgi:hypothetical protein